MYNFLDKLIAVSLPRVRDFRGLSPKAFDGRGNYTIGIKEQLVFPEIEFDDVVKVRGMDIVLVTTAKTNEEALALTTADGTLNDTFVNAVATIGEKITLRRFEIVSKNDDEFFGSYTHQGGRIVALTVVKGGDAQVAKNMAMQVASMNPTYVSRNEMPQDVVEHERSIQEELLAKDEKLASKPEKVKAGIIEGRVSKSLQDMCLVDQEYFLDADQKCGQYLKSNNAEVLSFVKYVVGEGIEKKEENFAAEVAAMAK